MTLIRLSIDRPVAVMAVMLVVLLFGGVGLWRMPIQLTPHIREPIISVETRWSGASPIEVEREILNPQEEALKGMKGLRRMTGTARQGKAVIRLELLPEANADHIALLVSNRLNQVGGYPRQVQQPVVWTAENDDEAMAVFVLSLLPGNDRPIDTYGDFIDSVVRERMERVSGVVRVDVYGGRVHELRVVLDPVVLAHYRLTVSEVADALRRADITATLGEINEGKRRYVVRVNSKLATIDSVRNVLLRAQEEKDGSVKRVTVGDVAMEVNFAYKNWSYISRYLGQPAISLYVSRESSINVLEAMRGLQAVVAELNEKVLKREGLILKQSYDETVFIDAAIAMVVQNIYVGGLLAFIVLLLFLRSMRATLIVVLSIPVSVVGAFIGMALLGRTVNIVSLAGIAFAVGMVVDAAIVVLESIFRLWQKGYARVDAAYTGTRQVWGAILASALTTVMVFVPVLTLELEVGQMFRDVAIALSVSVILSLFVAITVIPALACRLLGNVPVVISKPPVWIAGVDKVVQRFVAFVIGFVRYVSKSRLRATLVVGITTAMLALITWLFLPSFDYLPRGGAYNIVWAFLKLPSGYNLSNAVAIADNIENVMRPLWASETGPESAPGQPPKIDAFFLRAFRGGVFVEATAVDAQQTVALRSVLSEAFLPREPGAVSRVFQPSLFQSMGGGGRSIDFNISGFDLTQMLETARRVGQFFTERLPVKQGYLLFPKTSLELGAPEVRIIPDPLRLADAGVTASALVETVRALNEGLPVLEIDTNDQRVDLVLRGTEDRIVQTQDLGTLPIVTENGRILPLSALADLKITAGPIEIEHLEQRRTVTLQVYTPQKVPLETAIEQVQTQIIDPLTTEGLPPGITLDVSGSIGMLSKAWNTMMWQLLLAVAICYLLMVIIYESFFYPLLIMITLPQATAGAILGLALLNVWKPVALDMLTLLGFVILVGTVVNNAILIVHQTLHYIRLEAMAVNDAIEAAVRNRLRPIFMTTLTTLFGMLPLVVFPGMGAEVYNGLGAVVLGGLTLSAILTLLILPPLLSLAAGTIERRRLLRSRRNVL